MQLSLEKAEQANLLALILYRLLRSVERPLPEGVLLIRAGKMSARVILDEHPKIVSGEGPADCTIQASLGVLTRILSGEGVLLHWLTGRARVRGNPFKALALLKALR